MQLLFLSNYFPPEVNAPATRLYEHARVWVQDGHEVEVLTSVPNFPEGRVYDGYKNRFTKERIDSIEIARVPMYVTANEGVVRRTLSYLSYMISARWYASRMKTPDVVVATSPQFFAAVAGYLVARRLKVPFVLEIRDLWPESIVAVGAVRRSALIRYFERLEQFLYREADHIVVLTNAFKRFIEARGIGPDKITVLKNGADLEALQEPLKPERLESLRHRHNLKDKFVASYIGTIGMAHRVDIVLEAAQKCSDPEVVFLIAGAGSARSELEELQARLQLKNVRLLDKVPREEARYLLALTDVSIVHLKASPLFKTVIPSKIFEAMATRTPIVLGVEGESLEIIEEAEAGLPFQPENATELLEAVLRLKTDKALYARLAENGYAHVLDHYDRKVLARRYASLLTSICTERTEEAAPIVDSIES